MQACAVVACQLICVSACRVTDLAALKAKMPELRRSISSPQAFQQYYNFFFDYGKDSASKYMSMYWQILSFAT
jgi:hypothetical protein